MAASVGPRPNPTSSWWLANAPSVASAAVPPASCDLAIIGAGMTGCAVAHWTRVLDAAGGGSVVLLDARGVAGGATGRNGGHLWLNPNSAFEVDTTAELLQFIEDQRVECDLQKGGAAALTRREAETGVTYHDAAGDPEDAAAEEWGETAAWDESACRNRLQTDAFIAAEVYSDAAQFYPAKVAQALLQSSGATLVAPVCVVSLEDEPGGAGCLLSWRSADGADTPAEGVLHARRVVVATNGWTGELLPELQSHLYPARNQVLLTAPLPAAQDWQVGAFAVDGDAGARELYCIRRSDGRVCLGGARALEPAAAVGSTDDASLSDTVGEYLRRFLAERLPALAADGAVRVEAEWTGVLGFTHDGKPLIGPLPERPHVLVAAGFCGHGMPQCFGAGKAIAQILAGQPPEALHPHVRGAARVGRVFDGAE